ncbi:MAG: helix-turn-helix transcriptional regulator [Fibrobacteraceae bacterium]|nr:helix-turn-helix transcriptional regulator [Fibrobacteraceae bacterium]
MTLLKNKFLLLFSFVAVALGWFFVFLSFQNNEIQLFPSGGYEIFPLVDNLSQGNSTSELSVSDTMVSSSVNIRSGVAYPYAGIGFNLLSVNNRPASGYFDFSRYDSVDVLVTAGRMKTVMLRIHTDDPDYSRKGDYISYRPLYKAVPVEFSFTHAKAALCDFKVPDWWLAMNGMDNDDGFTFFNRGMLFEVANGEGALRGIPDDIEVKSVRLFGKNRSFISLMYGVGGAILLVYLVLLANLLRCKSLGLKTAHQDEIKVKMELAEKLLKHTDKSLAEIALEVGVKGDAQLERCFKKIYGQKPLAYRRNNNAS